MSTQPIFYITSDFERALGLEKIIPDFHIITLGNSGLINNARQAGVKIYVADEQFDTTDLSNSYHLLKHPLIQRYIAENSQGGQPAVMFFKIAPTIEKLTRKLGYRLLNSSAHLNRRYESKLSQYLYLGGRNINFPDTIITSLDPQKYEEIVDKLGDRFVIQFDRGHTGLGTVFINSHDDFLSLSQSNVNRKVRISRYISGEAWTINGCVTEQGIAYGGLNYQITGIDGFTDQKGGTIGNDWSRTSILPNEIIAQVANQTELVGLALKQGGFFGMFGIDFIVSESGELFVIEINARQPASTGMHTKLMLRNNLIPLMYLHIKHYYKELSDYFNPITPEIVQEQNRLALQPISASQLIPRKVRDPKYDYSKVVSGIVNDGSHRYGYSIDDLTTQEQILASVKPNSAGINFGYEVARFQTLNSHEAIIKYIKLNCIK